MHSRARQLCFLGRPGNEKHALGGPSLYVKMSYPAFNSVLSQNCLLYSIFILCLEGEIRNDLVFCSTLLLCLLTIIFFPLILERYEYGGEQLCLLKHAHHNAFHLRPLVTIVVHCTGGKYSIVNIIFNTEVSPASDSKGI